MVDRLEGALEDNILTVLCWSKTRAAELTLRLSPEIFSTRAYRRIAERAFEHIRVYREPPQAHIRDLFEKELGRGEEGRLLGRVLDAMDELSRSLQEDYVFAQLDRFVEQRRLTTAMEEASDALAVGDLDRARELIQASTSPPPGATVEGVWAHDPGRMLDFFDAEEDEEFALDIDELDDRGIVPMRKTLMMLIAPAKKGKSWFLHHVGRANMRRGKKVLHITLENSERVAKQRYLQTFFAMTKKNAAEVRTAFFKKNAAGQVADIEHDSRLAPGLREEGRAAMANRVRRMGRRGRLLIKEFPTATLTVAQLDAYLDHLDRAYGFRPDMLILDYPNLMKIDQNNLRVSLGAVVRELRGLCVRRNLAGVTVTQGNRIAAGAKVVDDRMVGEDYSMIGTADTVLAYSQTGDERRVGLGRLLVTNAREAEDKFIVLISQSYATGQFCLDSAYMSKHLKSELDRLTGAGDGEGGGDDD